VETNVKQNLMQIWKINMDITKTKDIPTYIPMEQRKLTYSKEMKLSAYQLKNQLLLKSKQTTKQIANRWSFYHLQKEFQVTKQNKKI